MRLEGWARNVGDLARFLEWDICVAATELPPLHRDPCDRFIIATAKRHRFPVVTDDSRFCHLRCRGRVVMLPAPFHVPSPTRHAWIEATYPASLGS